MLVTYDRYMREFRLKQLEYKLAREETPDERMVVPGVIVAQLMRQAVKDSCRGLDG